eukprot:COSAG02_NODE_5331_length_4431_cov_4.370729_3_plen_598_part_00
MISESMFVSDAFAHRAFFVAIAAKLKKVKYALAIPSSEDVAASMAFTFQRFCLGLASATDTADLRDFIEGLGVDEHSRAGLRLWKDKELVSHLSARQMGDLLAALEQDLPTSQQLGFHFTDLDSARLILTSLGIRASTVGQLGGGVSVCLASPAHMGWERLGGEAFAKTCGEELWGSKWHEVMPEPAPPGAHPDWGKWSKKLEVVLVLRVPSRENMDAKRLLPGRDLVYIAPAAECVAGKEGDTNVYLSNTRIEKVLILKPPDAASECKELEGFTEDTLRDVRVLCTSSRDANGAMTELSIRELRPDEQPDDELQDNPDAPWCPAVKSFTATVRPPSNPQTAYLEKHRRVQQANPDKKLWAENISRFTGAEMKAAIENFRQEEKRSHTLAFFYTSRTAAVASCEQGHGIIGTAEAGVTVSTKAPHELGWSKNCGERFVDTASTVMWGKGWREEHMDELQAVVVLGVPTLAIETQLQGGRSTFTMPAELMLEGQPPVFANAHIHKLYVLKPDSAPVEPSADLKALFERVDTDGDGMISRAEAMEFISNRAQHVSRSDEFIAGIWSTYDKNQDGALSIDEVRIVLWCAWVYLQVSIHLD